MEKYDAFSSKAGTSRCSRTHALAALAVISVFLLSPSLCSAAQITLAWDPNTEPAVSGYRVYYGTASHHYTAVIDVGNQTALTISGLIPGMTYFFSATAYSDSTGDESSFSGEIAYTVPGGSSPSTGSGGGGSGGGGCFIATAAYGSYLAPEVVVLRAFRDDCLLTSEAGRAFVDGYYRVSPPVAALISEHEMLKCAVRWGLTPLIYAVKYPAAALLMIVAIPLVIVIRKGGSCDSSVVFCARAPLLQ